MKLTPTSRLYGLGAILLVSLFICSRHLSTRGDPSFLTVRFATHLSYEATMVKDATADYSDEAMHADLEIDIPNYASAVVTTNEVIDSTASLRFRVPPLQA